MPPPMRKLMSLRWILNGGEVSVPVLWSPPKKLLTKPLPRKPLTGIWLGSVPRAGPGPNAVPVGFQSP
jgi:hypothetical protein